MERDDEAQKFNWRKELGKIAVIAIATVSCLFLIVYYPSLKNMLLSVGIIATVSYLLERRKVVEKYPMKNKAVLITGCDSGFGHLLALSLAEQGATVYAGCLFVNGKGATELKEKGSPSRMNVLQMDVTNMQQIQEVYEYVVQNGKGLWGVVNNAGLNFIGDIELSTMEQFEKVNDINYLGMVRVTKTFLPLIKQSKGRILNTTSVKGLFSEAFNGAYGSTKYAGEAFSDILRLEMHKFGVTVCIIEPCNFGGATGCCEMTRITKDFNTMWDNMPQALKDSYGRAYIDKHIKCMSMAPQTACFKLHLVTDAMEDALFNLKPKTRYLVPGGSGWIDIYRWRAYLRPFLPDWLMDKWLLSDIKEFPKPSESIKERKD